jgi:hypothetical protein
VIREPSGRESIAAVLGDDALDRGVVRLGGSGTEARFMAGGETVVEVALTSPEASPPALNPSRRIRSALSL